MNTGYPNPVRERGDNASNDISALIPGSVKFVEACIMAGALWYQGNLLWQVARDFVAPGNEPLMYAFTVTVLALIASVDFLVLRGFINLHYRTPWTGYLFCAVALILLPVFVLEVGRLNIVQNGTPLASVIAADFAKSVDPGIRAIEQTMRSEKDRDGSTRALIVAAIDAESKGIVRGDIEQQLADRGVVFRFSGHVGTSTKFQTTQNIQLQMEREITQSERTRDANRQILSGIRQDMIALASTPITKDNYSAVVRQQSQIAARLKELGALYSVDASLFAFRPVDSLFAVSVASAFSLSATSLLLWGIAVGTTFGGIVLALLTNAVVISHRLTEHGGLMGADVELTHIRRQIERREEQAQRQIDLAKEIVARAEKEAEEIRGNAEVEAEQIRWAGRKKPQAG